MFSRKTTCCISLHVHVHAASACSITMLNEHVKLMCIIYMFIIVYLTMLKLIYRLCALSSQYLAFCPVYAFFLDRLRGIMFQGFVFIHD